MLSPFLLALLNLVVDPYTALCVWVSLRSLLPRKTRSRHTHKVNINNEH